MSTANDLFSLPSISLFDFIEVDDAHHQRKDHDIHIIHPNSVEAEAAVSVDKFFEDVDSINHEFKQFKTLYKQLMIYPTESEFQIAFQKLLSILPDLKSLYQSNVDNLKLANCGPGSVSDRLRTFIFEGFREKLEKVLTNDPSSCPSIFSVCNFNDVDDHHQRMGHIHIIDPNSVEAEAAVSLDKFFKDVESINHELKDLKKLYKLIRNCHENSKTPKKYNDKQSIASLLDSAFERGFEKFLSIMGNFKSLYQSNVENLKLAECGPGSLSDRTRTFIFEELREKLEHMMNNKFIRLSEKIQSDNKDREQFTDRKNKERVESSSESQIYMQKKEEEQLIINDIKSKLDKLNL